MEPITELDARYSVEGATPTPWAEAREQVEGAQTFWLSTVRADGSPHVTTLLAVWQDDVLHFCTGPGEQKALNLETNRRCALTTGASSLSEGLDVVVEGVAEQVTDQERLKRLADAYEAKYGSEWHFDVGEDSFLQQGGLRALVFGVAPVKVLAFRKGDHSSQTRYRFKRS
ncbi:pyridoxamine 5'-phosphate oxidase family protein [Nonomuraea rhizosphaerae]|uniref:pyridoxamine 5'-phosphate oxidase family protein n=1 Tax=Nonomuraea rhizosphaerae TaxID=2665663 RepID=UPI001C5CFE22|nr:pyridoxamine 5'-phosphate oxidase family protein [Nonomuraea rhizosphaerae]